MTEGVDEHTYSDGLHVWDVYALWRAAEELTPTLVSLKQLEEDGWDVADCWATQEDDERVASADLSYPIILTPKGRVADGHHRLKKAWLEGRTEILAVRFEVMPEASGRILSRLERKLLTEC